MLRAAVIEAGKNRREMITAGIDNLMIEVSATAFSNIYDYKEQLGKDASAYDMLLLNTTIREEGDGVALAKEIRSRNSRVMICFLTDSEQYYREAFELLATGYMVYPFDFRELNNCINFYFQMAVPERRSSLMIKETGGSYRRIYARDIRYIESANREILLHLEDESTLSGYMKLDEAQKNLPVNQFFRCHQSYMVNFYFVEEMNRDSFTLGDEQIPISRKYQKDAKDAYYEYTFRTMES